MRERLITRSYFRATVASWDIEGMKDPSVAASTIAAAWPAIELLFDAATSCLVFGEDRLAVRRLSTRQPAMYHTEWPAWAPPRARSTFGRTLQLQDACAARDFMSTALARGVVQLFSVDPERLDTEGLLPRLSDPIQVDPPFGSAPNGVKRYLRKVTAGKSPHVLLSKNAYGLDAELHGPAEVITEWFDRMLTIGHRTAGFQRGQCQYYVRPFEVGSILLWEGVSRNRHGLDVATERLAAAVRDPNATELTTPRALAAAELLAAVAGRPPRIYTEEQRDLDWRIAAWVEEKRGNFSIARDDLALARRALDAILERSVFPETMWRTLPPKVEWEQATRELLDRVAAAERDAPASHPADAHVIAGRDYHRACRLQGRTGRSLAHPEIADGPDNCRTHPAEGSWSLRALRRVAADRVGLDPSRRGDACRLLRAMDRGTSRARNGPLRVRWPLGRPPIREWPQERRCSVSLREGQAAVHDR